MHVTHVIPDSVERGDDLGGGLVVVLAAFGSLLLPLPVPVLIHVLVLKRLDLKTGEEAADVRRYGK